ncbi:hypothetical protein BKA65DRAFT_535139 [Rhexocercosporidium sp. MPI-PUGE-AT-0058]|nr:hypothetical protein BKA65DRAFT_535139 [Rhexocercosporidium sp. MPI-PUGE-AT-0058]
MKPIGEKQAAPMSGPSGNARSEDAKMGTKSSGPDKGKGKVLSEPVLDIQEGQVFNMRELAQHLSKCQKPLPASHPTYTHPNGIPFSELGLPYTVVAGIVRKQLEADDLPPSRHAMLKENTDYRQGPDYSSPDQLYEVRECIGGKGRGMFATLNIRKGQLIMSEQPLITLYFHDNIINWVDNIAVPAMGLLASSPQETASNTKSAIPAETETKTKIPHPSEGTKGNSRRFIAKVSQAFSAASASSANADPKYSHRYGDDEEVTVSELNRSDATGGGPNMTNIGGNPSLSSLEQNTNSLADDDTRTQVRKRLLADFEALCESDPTKADALKRLHVDHEYRYGGEWLMRLWQRYSRGIPIPGRLNPELIEPDLTAAETSSPSHCCSLFQKMSFINHCCFSNAELRFRYDPPGACHADLYATVDILRNDEITLYYNEEDRIKRHETSEMTSGVENVFGFSCGCEPCLGGYTDRATWNARD